MHPKNPHIAPYQMEVLCEVNNDLTPFVIETSQGKKSISFQDEKAVFQLNKSLLLHHYNLVDYQLPDGYLCPAVPGRMDYLCYIKELLEAKGITHTPTGLDVGTGANAIYTLLGAQHFNWQMIGIDTDEKAVAIAKKNLSFTPELKKKASIRWQENKQYILSNVLTPTEKIDFTVCNPPFYTSEEEANKVAFNKLKALFPDQSINQLQRNFGGQSNELWCNGGELLFIKRMIKQSVPLKDQIGFFSTLVSKKEHLNTFYKLLNKNKASHKTIKMEQGNKVSHLLVWEY